MVCARLKKLDSYPCQESRTTCALDEIKQNSRCPVLDKNQKLRQRSILTLVKIS